MFGTMFRLAVLALLLQHASGFSSGSTGICSLPASGCGMPSQADTSGNGGFSLDIKPHVHKYTHGTKYTITLRHSSGTYLGFRLQAKPGNSATVSSNLIAGGGLFTIPSSGANSTNLQVITCNGIASGTASHTASRKGAPRQEDDVEWTAPSTGHADITFYAVPVTTNPQKYWGSTGLIKMKLEGPGGGSSGHDHDDSDSGEDHGDDTSHAPSPSATSGGNTVEATGTLLVDSSSATGPNAGKQTEIKEGLATLFGVAKTAVSATFSAAGRKFTPQAVWKAAFVVTGVTEANAKAAYTKLRACAAGTCTALPDKLKNNGVTGAELTAAQKCLGAATGDACGTGMSCKGSPKTCTTDTPVATPSTPTAPSAASRPVFQTLIVLLGCAVLAMVM